MHYANNVKDRLMKVYALALSALALAACAKQTTITVENPSQHDRKEVVAMPVEDLGMCNDFIMTDAEGREVPYQLTHDGKVLFVADLKAGAAAQFHAKAGKPAEAAKVAVGKHYPERVDDIAWENDRVAFRTYGPALQRSGERAFGYDVWTKRVDHPVVEQRYATELDPQTKAKIDSLRSVNPAQADSLARATSYHYDHGNGNDCYKVGPTLGGGTAAIMLGDTIVYPYCYKDFQILDNGPLRFSVKLVYEPTVIGADTVTETRIISLDAHSQLNRTIVSYEGLRRPVDVAAGIVLHHPDGGQNMADADKGIIAYADPTDTPEADNGTIFVGAYMPNCHHAAPQMFADDERHTLRGDADGHMLAKAKYTPGESMEYFWGSGWTKWGFNSFDDWQNYMNQFADNQRNPLKITVNK